MDRRGITALLVTGLALFMIVLDNLVVTTALPSIRTDLGASVRALEWSSTPTRSPSACSC